MYCYSSFIILGSSRKMHCAATFHGAGLLIFMLEWSVVLASKVESVFDDAASERNLATVLVQTYVRSPERPEPSTGALQSGAKAGADGAPILTCEQHDSIPGGQVVLFRSNHSATSPLCAHLGDQVQRIALQTNLWGAGIAADRQLRALLTTESLGRAAKPSGYGGARFRLQKASEKLINGEPLNIIALGGSMTHGAGSKRAWPQLLNDYFRTLGVQANVSNQAVPSSTSRYIVAYLEDIPGLYSTDLFIIDYAINDYGEDPHFHMNLLQMLLGLRQRPAVIDLETFTSFGPSMYTNQFDTRAVQSCINGQSNSWFVHSAAAKKMEVPLVSFSEAICHTNRTWWTKGESHEDTHTGLIHPGDITHDLVARTMLGVLALEVDQVCEKGVTGQDHSLISNSVATRVKCLRTPLTKSHHRFQSLAVEVSPAWHYGKDIENKPTGWISDADGLSGEIAFDVMTLQGWIQIEFLGTYENIGSATCWLDATNESQGNSCTLQGLWSRRASLSRFMAMRTSLPRGRHRLKCRSDGKKFKMLAIASC